MKDFLGNELSKGDNVLIIYASHFRKSVIEEILPNKVKIKGLKFHIYPIHMIKQSGL